MLYVHRAYYLKMYLLCLDFDDRFDHTLIIREHYVYLVDTLDAKHSGLVTELYQAEVLNAEERDTINSEVISFTQNEKLLSMLSRKTNDQFDKFLDALDNTGQQHVHSYITNRIGLFIRKTQTYCPSVCQSARDDHKLNTYAMQYI